ncbi:hypothetical protein [Spirillospora sp. NPDC047279]|uniref:hypothetical protein n=1 Tax=Spirillospora sp. NPDC047279 TaxID=3155478 RepID=UPI0033FB3F98
MSARTGDAPYAVVVLDLSPDGDQVSGIYAVTDPDKLAHVEPDTTGDDGRD